MTELETLTIRADMLDIIAKCQSVLIRIGSPPVRKTPDPNRTPHSESATAKIRALIFSEFGSSESFSIADIIKCMSEKLADLSIPEYSVRSTVESMIKKGSISIVTKRGNGSTKPTTYRVVPKS